MKKRCLLLSLLLIFSILLIACGVNDPFAGKWIGKLDVTTQFDIIYPETKITGIIVDYVSSEPIPYTEVQLYEAENADKKNEKPIQRVLTDEQGSFSLSVEGNDIYKMVVVKDGYEELRTTQVVIAGETKYTEKLCLIKKATQGETGIASGTISNAIDGTGMDDVSIKVREEWNSTEGDYFGDFETSTNKDGEYTIDGIPDGYYTVEASQGGFVSDHTNIIVTEGNTDANFDFTITPELNENEIRIVLTWGKKPYDLDAYLVGTDFSGKIINVCFDDKRYKEDGIVRVNLDVDDKNSYGPETITILKDIVGTYTYYVHNFSNRFATESNALSLSDARVRVYKGSSMITEYYVPSDKVGVYWTVFQIDEAGTITSINSVSNELDDSLIKQ